MLPDSRLPHVLLIDIASRTNGTGDYHTVETLEKCLINKNASYEMEVMNNIILFIVE